MARKSLVSILRKGILSGSLATSMISSGCGGGGGGTPEPPKPRPSYSQTAELENDVNIRYGATFENMPNPTRSITRNGTQFGNDLTIPSSPYSEVLQNLQKGRYVFTMRTTIEGVSPILLEREVPNYIPTADFSSLQNLSLNQGSSIIIGLEGLVANSDKNLEDRPVPLTSISVLSGNVLATIESGYNIKLVVGAPGLFEVKTDYGSPNGGTGTGTIKGQIVAVPEQILFWSNMDQGSGELYSKSIDGSNLQRLTNNQFQEGYPSSSPDGLKIVFDTNQEDVNGDGIREFSIYTMDIDGSNRKRVSPNIEHAYSPSWCKNRTIFFNYQTSGVQGIASIKPDGTEYQELTRDQFNNWLSGRPTCSSDSLQISYVKLVNGKNDIFVKNLDTGIETNITNTSDFEEVQPSWSPDGTRILFRSNRSNNDPLNFDLYSMTPNGGDIRRLTSSSDSELDAVWSFDGSKIFFTLFRSLITDTFPQIYSMNSDGSNLLPVTNTTAAHRFPSPIPK